MRIATVILLLFAVPAAAYAQTAGSSIFVEGALFGDRDTSNRLPDVRMTPGGGATIGGNLTPRFSFRFDVEIPTSHVYTYDDFSSGGYRSHRVTSERAVIYGALFGWHVLPRGQRVDLALLAGFSAAATESRSKGFADTVAKDGSVVRHDEINYDFSSLRSPVTLGTDVAVALTAHLSVVPEVRFSKYSEFGTVTRPRVALRWTF